MPVSGSRGQGRARGMPVQSDTAGCHCSTAMCCCCTCPEAAVRKIYCRVAPKNTVSAFMSLVVSQDAKFSDVAAWDTQMELAPMKDYLQREKLKSPFWGWVEVWITNIL